jgi:RND family efflux transporter MFP subunit
MKKAIIISTSVIVVTVSAYLIYRSRQPSYSFAVVKRGDIVQQVFASGNVESPTSLHLQFKSTGKLSALKVKIGDKVKAGGVLAALDAGQLQASLDAAQADVLSARAGINALLKGPTAQTLAVYEQSISTAKLALSTAVRDAYLKVQDSFLNKLNSLFMNDTSANPTIVIPTESTQTALSLNNSRVDITSRMSRWNSLLDASVTSDQTISESSGDIATAKSFVDLLSAQVNRLNPGNSGMTNDAIDADVAVVNAAATEINAAETGLNAALQSYKAAADQLSLIQASSTPEDLQIAEAGLAKAQANIASIRSQLDDSVLVAPEEGIVTDTNGDVGEVVAAGTDIVSLMPDTALDIKLNVSEDNVVGVKVGQPASISLDAFPASAVWLGEVVSIDPAETVIGGAVYYRTTILFDKADPDIRSGMTANVLIQTGSASSTLIVPASAIQANGAETFIQVYLDGKVTDHSVSIGLKSQDGMVEIRSGLSEGQQVVTGSR